MSPADFQRRLQQIRQELPDFFLHFVPTIIGRTAVSFFKRTFQTESCTTTNKKRTVSGPWKPRVFITPSKLDAKLQLFFNIHNKKNINPQTNNISPHYTTKKHGSRP
ncbi:MAG: hypothetical protein MJZ77_03010 [Bacteroidales bacterium]|nr:hypothetical protein [Bacteroidales bacterium]